MKKPADKRPIPFIRKLCAHLSENEIEEAEERLRQFLRFSLRVHGTKKDGLEGRDIDN